MNAKPGLSVEEHFRAGRHLYDIRNLVLKLSVDIGNAYPLNSPQLKQVERALSSLDKTRSAMEDAFFKDHPRTATAKAYYPAATDNLIKDKASP